MAFVRRPEATECSISLSLIRFESRKPAANSTAPMLRHCLQQVGNQFNGTQGSTGRPFDRVQTRSALDDVKPPALREHGICRQASRAATGADSVDRSTFNRQGCLARSLVRNGHVGIASRSLAAPAVPPQYRCVQIGRNRDADCRCRSAPCDRHRRCDRPSPRTGPGEGRQVAVSAMGCEPGLVSWPPMRLAWIERSSSFRSVSFSRGRARAAPALRVATVEGRRHRRPSALFRAQAQDARLEAAEPRQGDDPPLVRLPSATINSRRMDRRASAV
jgi:hypothetical protein